MGVHRLKANTLETTLYQLRARDDEKAVIGVTGYAWCRTSQARRMWCFARAGRFLLALPDSAALSIVENAMRRIEDVSSRIEDVVSAIPLAGADDVRSFAVVEIPASDSDDGRTITAIVRGEAAIDIVSVGGARRFASGGVQPWVLADFRSVTGLVIGAVEETVVARLEVPQEARAISSGITAASRLYWSQDARPETVDARTTPRPQSSDPPAPAEADSRDSAAGDIERTISYVRPQGERGAGVDEETLPRAAFGETIVTRRGALRQAVVPESVPVEQAPVEQAPLGPAMPEPAARFGFRVLPGEAYGLDAPTFIGRKPRAPAIVSGAIPRVVRVASATGEVSATHLRLETAGDSVVVTDLRSTNGTVVRAPGAPESRLRPGESRVALPGTTIEIGDGNIIEIVPGSGQP